MKIDELVLTDEEMLRIKDEVYNSYFGEHLALMEFKAISLATVKKVVEYEDEPCPHYSGTRPRRMCAECRQEIEEALEEG